MLNYEIYCVMTGGQALTGEARSQLFKAAAKMVKDKSQAQEIHTDSLEGLVQTDFQYAVLGAVSGLSFRAEVESARGKSQVNFIVRDCDLASLDPKKGFWLDVDPRRAAEAHLN